MSVVCLKAYRESRGLTLIESKPSQADVWSYQSNVKEEIEARYGDHLPAHFAKTMSKPQSQPYKHGDTHSVAYRKKTTLSKRNHIPVPCEVTPKSCRKSGDTFLLGSNCLEGIDEPLAWIEMKYQVTLNFLKSLPNGSKVCITTRSDLVAHDDYIAELSRLQVTVRILAPIFTTEEILRLIEPGAPSIKRRTQAVEKLKSLGINAEIEYHSVPQTAQMKAVLGL